MTYKNITVPSSGEPISITNNTLNVPNNPIITYIEGDGIGIDITPVMLNVVNTAVKKAYGGEREIHWMEIYAGEKADSLYGEYLPEETVEAIKEFSVSIKGPLTTPVGGGMRSLNVAIRQILDLYICQRPVQYFDGTPSPVKHPEKVDMVIFRENSEDIYAGIEFPVGSKEVKKVIDFLQDEMGATKIRFPETSGIGMKKVIDFLQDEMGATKIRFPETSGIGIKPVSTEGTIRLVRAAIQYAIDNDKSSVTLVHKGNIMKFTEGLFRDTGYQLAKDEFGAKEVDGGPWCSFTNPNTGKEIIVKDSIADAFLQQILIRPAEYSVIATLNLNGDYISDALAAQVGGIGIAPGANLSDSVGVFEATHGTAPGYAGKDMVNPSSLILSAEMMLRHMGWTEAADLIINAMSKIIQNKTVTYDLERLIDDATLLSCSEFGKAIEDSIK